MSLHSFSIILLLVAASFSCTLTKTNHKPIIGIISTPSDLQEYYSAREYSYIKGSYAEFIEAGDGIPIAIPWDLPERDLIRVLDSVNGILLTGGDAELWEQDIDSRSMVFNNFTKRTSMILKYAMHLNEIGIHYPVYGICQGFEVITMGVAGKPSVIDFFRHPGQLDIVEITNAGMKSKMFGGMPDHLVDFIKETRSMFYNHRFGFNMSLLEDNEVLEDFFKITARGKDDNGKEFIAALEAKNYPIYIVQYHPERVLSEWKNKTQFDHPDEAVQAIIVQAEFFVGEARKNDQVFVTREALAGYLLENHEGIYINRTWPNTYFYDKKSPIIYEMHEEPEEHDLDQYDCYDHDCSFINRYGDL